MSVIDKIEPIGMEPQVHESMSEQNAGAKIRSACYVNHIKVQMEGNELNLSLFQFSPSELENKDQLEIDTASSDCVSCINMSALTAKDLIEALQEQIDANGNLRLDKEIEDDNRNWTEAFAASSPEQLAKLEQMFREDEERDGTGLLEFSAR